MAMSNSEWISFWLKAAQNRHARARRYLESPIALNQISYQISTACYNLMEAWLRYYNIKFETSQLPDVRTKFCENAPESLRSKMSSCIADASTIDYKLEEDCFRDEDEPPISIDWVQF